jgi:hypothetical protein
MTRVAVQLAIFVVTALPGYVLAIARLDRIGHRRLQGTGFASMAACFAVIATVPGMTTTVAPFLLVCGVSCFFTEFEAEHDHIRDAQRAVPGSHARDRARDLCRDRQVRSVH